MTRPPRVVVLGMMSRIPVAGVIWQTLHYLLGFERLGCETWYVEAHGSTPRDFFHEADDRGWERAAAFVASVVDSVGLARRWAFHARYGTEACYGLTREALVCLYASADIVVNLHGGTDPLAEHAAGGPLVLLETDPVHLQVELHDGVQAAIDYLEPHSAFFTFGENLGRPGCGLPVSERFPFKPTRQPVVIDHWPWVPGGADAPFTTVGNWRQLHRPVTLDGEVYSWSKDREFERVLDLPSRSTRPLELALSAYTDDDRVLLEGHGWRVREALPLSTDRMTYQRYVTGSGGEFTVAKDQNVRLRTGWFSDRSACYLASGRPVVTQETGFSDFLPTGEGLFGFSNIDEAAAAFERIDADYERSRRAARAVAEECFRHDVVLGALLDDVGVERPRVRRTAITGPLSLDADITVHGRWPTRLAEETIEMAAGAPLPVARAGGTADRTPTASVVVVTYGQLAYTRMCVETVLAATASPDFELVIVDNASPDGTLDYLRQLAARVDCVRLVLNDENRGFGPALNQGFTRARGDVLVALNNDTLPPPGWLTGLIAHLADPAIGLVGPVTNRTCNEAQIDAPYETYGGMQEFAATRSQRYLGRVSDIPMLAMFCVAMRREAWQKVGAVDERFGIGMFEDDDFAVRVRAAGYRVVCAEDVFVHHFGQASIGELVPSGDYQRLFDRNRQQYERKWDVQWSGHGRRVSDEYCALRRDVRAEVTTVVPTDASVLVVSKGDDELLQLGGRNACHFPVADDGRYDGAYPPDSAAAVAHLEHLRGVGADFIVFPKPAFWWLRHYGDFAAHLTNRCRTVHESPACVIYALDGGQK